LLTSITLPPNAYHRAPAATRRFALTFEFIRFRFDDVPGKMDAE